MHAPVFFCGYRLPRTTFAWRSVTTGTDFPLIFYVEKLFPVFGAPSPCHKSDKKRVCNRASVCVLLFVPILLARVQTTSMCPNSYNTIFEAGDAAIRNAAVWLFWRSNRNHYLFVLIMRALATSIHVRPYEPTKIQ